MEKSTVQGQILILLILAALTSAAYSQTSVELVRGTTVMSSPAYYELLQEARRLYQQRDYAKAAEAYERLAEAYPFDGENWLRLGNSRYFLKQYQSAIESYKKARELGFGFQQRVAYIIAACHAQLGEKE
jgi:tetratricopeptide (TPR) repeat protein